MIYSNNPHLSATNVDASGKYVPALRKLLTLQQVHSIALCSPVASSHLRVVVFVCCALCAACVRPSRAE